jgi:DNA polymerase elongation subunit (family B)
MKSNEPKILLVDIETAPNLGWFWEMWETNPIGIKTNWHLLSFSYKWLGLKHIHTHALPDYASYKKDKDDDKELVQDLWNLLNEADIVIAHNGDAFDIKKSNARFIFHGMKPPMPYKTIDTLKVARRHFKFDSNKLNSLGKYLGVGEKLPHTGAHLWFGCMAGDKKAWAMMRKYNEQDINLLERVYLQLRPWMTNHPNVNIYDQVAGACPSCSGKVEKRGFGYTQLGAYQRYKCLRPSCGAWSKGITIRSDLNIRP